MVAKKKFSRQREEIMQKALAYIANMAEVEGAIGSEAKSIAREALTDAFGKEWPVDGPSLECED